jgi:hypothetical protein
MPRPTKLRMLSERPVSLVDPAEDERSVIEAFPRQVTDTTMNQADADLLELLRRSHDRMTGEVAQATTVATEAMNRVDGMADGVRALLARTEAAEAKTEQVGHAAISALKENAAAVRTSAREKLTATAGVLSRLSAFAIDRLPALAALGSAFWLWRDTLSNPTPIQLVALGLYGACVIGPAVWLSARTN